MAVEKVPVPQSLNLAEIQGILSEGIQRLRNGETSAANVNALSNASGKILQGTKLQMEYYRLIGKSPDIPFLAAQVEAGPDAPSPDAAP